MSYFGYRNTYIVIKGQAVLLAPGNTKTNATLAQFVSKVLGRQGLHIEKLFTMSGGAIQENWKMDLRSDDGEEFSIVLRTDAKTKIPGSLSKKQEFNFLSMAWQAGVKVPEPLYLCEDVSIIGKPFILLEYLPGTTDFDQIRQLNIGETLGYELGVELAKIHTIKPDETHSVKSLSSKDFVQQKIKSYQEFFDDRGEANLPSEWAMRWCLSRLEGMTPSAVTLIHGDFRTANYLVTSDGLSGLLDWEFSGWGDPYSDLGWFCAKCWRYGMEATPAGGVSTRTSFYKGYSSVSSKRVDNDRVLFWEVMSLLSWLVIAIQQGDRNFIGGEKDLELGLTGLVRPPEIEQVLLELTSPASWTSFEGRENACAQIR
ncbi:phosphotransferase family protein [Kiloniella sp. EL199]|uniref:phosphotransferase family protein n=1 Tax=Kiloniella sp. EL199 TaxID=2107581 RepID=UPI000EA18B89|nr:phosphotransferase family protein [Kiloniella sp. EL199]